MPSTRGGKYEQYDRHVEFATEVDAQARKGSLDEPKPCAIFLRTPTLPTGDKGADLQLYPASRKPPPSAPLADHPVPDNAELVDDTSASGRSGSRHDDSSNPQDRNDTVSPASSRSNSPTGSPAQKHDEDLAGLTPKLGSDFGCDGLDATTRRAGDEDEVDDLKDIGPESARTLQPPTAGILGIRVPRLDDVRDASSHYQPPPSEADVTDRGETAFIARRQEILTTVSPIDSGDLDSELSDTLENQLDRAMEYRPNHREGFMPRGKLETIVNVSSVERELRKLGTVPAGLSVRGWAEVICGELSSISVRPSIASEEGTTRGSDQTSYRKIFAVLIQMKLVDTIFDFIREEVSDDDLPLMQYISAEESESSKDGRLQLCRKNDGSRPVSCFTSWRNYSVRTFFGDQWSMVSPFFARGEHRNVRNYQLENSDILPFTYDSRDEPGPRGQAVVLRGGFGEVFKVRIHHDHHSFEAKKGFPRPRDGYFAVKKLYTTNVVEWKSEIEILKRFTANPNPHLISLLATYEKSGYVHLIFYWADADLQKYWKDVKSSPPQDLRTTRWVARQCRGIASGIVEIHRHLSRESESSDGHKNNSLYGRHGDIKPRNILWFKDGPDDDGMGTLVITDFGIAEMNSKNSRSGKSNRNIKFSPTYCAPEAHVPGGEIRQSYDIWTLGCLYLEFLTWLLGGWKLVHAFACLRQTTERASSGTEAKLDRFFELETSHNNIVTGARVKSEVTEFIERLRGDPACTPFIHDFLHLIQEELLIIETKDRPRFPSSLLLFELLEMEKKIEANPAYGETLINPGVSHVAREHLVEVRVKEDLSSKVREFLPRATM